MMFKLRIGCIYTVWSRCVTGNNASAARAFVLLLFSSVLCWRHEAICLLAESEKSSSERVISGSCGGDVLSARACVCYPVSSVSLGETILVFKGAVPTSVNIRQQWGFPLTVCAVDGKCIHTADCLHGTVGLHRGDVSIIQTVQENGACRASPQEATGLLI